MNLFTVGLGFALHAGTGGVHTQGTAVAADQFGNTYVTGTFSGTVNFNPGPSPTLLTSFGRRVVVSGQVLAGRHARLGSNRRYWPGR